MIGVRLHPAARRELHQAVDWYLREAGKPVAASLLDDFEQVLALLREHPDIGVAGSSETRRIVFKRFPFTLVYRVRGQTAEVIALAHHSRRPEYWAGRV